MIILRFRYKNWRKSLHLGLLKCDSMVGVGVARWKYFQLNSTLRNNKSHKYMQKTFYELCQSSKCKEYMDNVKFSLTYWLTQLIKKVSSSSALGWTVKLYFLSLVITNFKWILIYQEKRAASSLHQDPPFKNVMSKTGFH